MRGSFVSLNDSPGVQKAYLAARGMQKQGDSEVKHNMLVSRARQAE